MAGGCSSALLLFCNVVLGLVSIVVLGAGLWGLSDMSWNIRAFCAVPSLVILMVSFVGCCAGSKRGRCSNRLSQIVYLFLLLGSLFIMSITSFFLWGFSAEMENLREATGVHDLAQDQQKGLAQLAEMNAEVYVKGNCAGGGTSAIRPAAPLPDTWTSITCPRTSTNNLYKQLTQVADKTPLNADKFWTCVDNVNAGTHFLDTDKVPTEVQIQLFCHVEMAALDFAHKYSEPLAYASMGSCVLMVLLILATLRMLCVPREQTVEEQAFLHHQEALQLQQQQQFQQQQLHYQQQQQQPAREIRQSPANVL